MELTKDVINYLVLCDERLTYLHADLTVALEWMNRGEIWADLITVEGDWPDELMSAAWRLLWAIDARLGPIATIDGQDRENFPPWTLPTLTTAYETYDRR